MNEIMLELVKKIKDLGIKLDCYSTKGSGTATEDCDIAIDFYDRNKIAGFELLLGIRDYGLKNNLKYDMEKVHGNLFRLKVKMN
jgi:hypothetical protein